MTRMIAAVAVAVVLAGCGTDETEQIVSPFDQVPTCIVQGEEVPAHVAFASVDCCEPGAALMPGDSGYCGIYVADCGGPWTHRIIGNEWVAERDVPACP